MKELLRTIVLVLLVGVAIYYAFEASQVNNRMDALNAQDSIHVVNIKEFDHNLHDLELQFIGRGKHIQEFQHELKMLNLRLDKTEQLFASKIDSVSLLISELRMNIEAELTRLGSQQEQTANRLSQLQRQTNRTILDLQTAASRLNRELGDLEKRVKKLETPPEEKKKK